MKKYTKAREEAFSEKSHSSENEAEDFDLEKDEAEGFPSLKKISINAGKKLDSTLNIRLKEPSKRTDEEIKMLESSLSKNTLVPTDETSH